MTENSPWRQANTKKLAHIQQVRIYARLCGPVWCNKFLRNIVIKVDGHTCAKYHSTTDFISIHTFECDRVGREVEIRAFGKTHVMLCEVQVFGKYGGRPVVTKPKPPKAVPSKKLAPPPCIDKHNLSKHLVGSSWVTKVPADGLCYHYSCTGKLTNGTPVLTDCMDASGRCITPSPRGTKFACRPNDNEATECACVRRLDKTTVDIL